MSRLSCANPPAAPQSPARIEPPAARGAALLERVGRCPTLPAMPMVAVELLGATSAREADLPRLARIAAKDAALVAGLLRAANASHYGLRRRVTSIAQAMPILGLRNLRTLVAGLALLPTIGRSRHGGVDPTACSRRGLFSAAAARRLAERFGAPSPDDCFLSALLMDLGTLALAEVLGPAYADLTARAGRHADLDRLEREELGLGHAEVGAALVRRWKLPEGLAPPIQFHHDPDAAPEGPDRLSARVLALAGLCADVFLEHNPLWPIAEWYRLGGEWFGLGKAEADLLLEAMAAETRDLAATFDVKVDASATFARARQRVAEEFASAPPTAAGPRPAADHRREPRSPRSGSVAVIPCTSAGAGQPLRAELLDLSPSGIGLVCPTALEAGTRFVIGMRPAAGRVTVVLYEVRHCGARDTGYVVGAELVRAVREQELRNDPQSDSPLHRVGRMLLGAPV